MTLRTLCCCSLLLVASATNLSADATAPLSGATLPLLLHDSYPLEVSVSFHAALLHWMDSLAGLNGAGLTAGKTERAYRVQFQELLGGPTDEDMKQLRDFADTRMRFAGKHRNGDVDALTRAFLEGATLEESLASASELIGREETGVLRTALEHFELRYEPVWEEGKIPKRFVERAQRTRKRRAMAKFLVRVADFFGVSPLQKPYPRVVLVPVVDGAGTHAQAIGRHLLFEIRPWEGLVDESAPIVHENAHFLFYRIDRQRRESLQRVAHEMGPRGRTAWRLLLEALPTAIAQGVAYQRFVPGRWSMDQRWYHIDSVDRYAKRLFPLVKQVLADDGVAFDEAFLRKAVALYDGQ